jgi:hypothetical protein
MDAILTRAGDLPVTRTPAPETDGITQMVSRFLLTMAQTAAERLVSPQRDLSPEWYRFPLP